MSNHPESHASDTVVVSANSDKDQAMTQKMYDIFDEVVEASQDPNNHLGFEQLRKHLSENQVSDVVVASAV